VKEEVKEEVKEDSTALRSVVEENNPASPKSNNQKPSGKK
jgi:hypothetical protein